MPYFVSFKEEEVEYKPASENHSPGDENESPEKTGQTSERPDESIVRQREEKTPDATTIRRFLKENTFLDLKKDYAFKRIFGTEKYKPYLIALLNAILAELGYKAFHGLRYLNNERSGENKRSPKIFFDVFCLTSGHQRIITEMQRAKQEFYYDRNEYYGYKAVVEQGVKGKKWDYRKDEVFHIAILDFIDDPETKEYIDEAPRTWKRKQNGQKFFQEGCHFIYIRLPIFNKKAEECVTTLDKFIFTLKHAGELKEVPIFALKDDFFRELYETLKLYNLAEKDIMEYIKVDVDYDDDQIYYDQQIEKGIKKGKLEGLQEGEKKGERRGLQKAQIQTARNLLSMGMPVDLISKATGLSEKEIEKLK